MQFYGRFASVNIRLSSVAASDRLRLAEKAMPTLEKSRSTVADVAGQPRYCRATGDLWSENGMGLFGSIYAHGMTDTWVMEKVLIGLVACESERHTHENIKKWTDEALEGIGLTATQLL